MSFFDDYKKHLLSLVDYNPPQVLRLKYHPDRRWDAVSLNVVPFFAPMANLTGVFLGNRVRADVVLTTENNKLVNKVAVQCEPETLHSVCCNILTAFYSHHSGVSSKKLRDDETIVWLFSLTRYNYRSNEAFHKNIFDLAKYADDNDKNLIADHKKNILVLISLLKKRMDDAKKTTP